MRLFKDPAPPSFHRSPSSSKENTLGIVQVKMSRRIVSVVGPPISGTMASRRRLVFSSA